MSESEIQRGKSWVEAQLRVAAEGAGISLATMAWGQSGDDFSRELYALRLEFEGGSLVERFSGEDLEDCPNDSRVREKLLHKIQEIAHHADGVRHFEKLKDLAMRRPPELLAEPVRSQALAYLRGSTPIQASGGRKLGTDAENIVADLAKGRKEYWAYRKRFRDKRPVLDQLVQQRLIEAKDGYYQITLLGLLASKLEDRISAVLQDLSTVYDRFSSLALANPSSEKPVTSTQLAETTGLAHDRVVEMLDLLIPVPANLWKAVGKDQNGVVHVTPNVERILDYPSIDSILPTLEPATEPSGGPSAPVLHTMTTGSPKVFETATATYTSLSQIGQGGSGVVQKVRDDQGKAFALKYLGPGHVTADRVKRFRNEVSFCEQDVHENIIRVVDQGFIILDGKKCPFYVMPVCDDTLRRLMASRIERASVPGLFLQMLAGVEAAHRKGVWHRDLKPENVLYDRSSDRLIVADFGIAHFAEDQLLTTVETRPSDRLANFQYAAPEQRQKDGKVDHRADIFALGLILNEMFTGRLALGVGYQAVGEIAPEFRSLDGLIQDMLRTNPARRPQDIATVRQELVRVQQGVEVWRKEKGHMSKSGVTIANCDLAFDGRCEAPPTGPPQPVVIFHDQLGRQTNACKRCSEYRIASGEWHVA